MYYVAERPLLEFRPRDAGREQRAHPPPHGLDQHPPVAAASAGRGTGKTLLKYYLLILNILKILHKLIVHFHFDMAGKLKILRRDKERASCPIFISWVYPPTRRSVGTAAIFC